MSDPLKDAQPHDEAEALLPWYATGQLEARDRLVVERHLSSCAHCRQQLGLERRLVEEFRSFSPEVDAGWARLRKRMEPRHALRSRDRRSAVRSWKFVRHPAVAAIAAAQLVLLVIGAGWLLALSRPTYHALGSASAPSSADLIIIFRPTTSEEDVRNVLRGANATIVDGPTDADAYLLHVPPQQRSRALARLQANREVQMAQPIDGSLQ